MITPWFGRGDLLDAYCATVALADEVILIDNGNAPETAKRLTTLARTDERVILISNETNRGFAAANNQGLFRASGKLVVFLNSDVEGSPDWITDLRNSHEARVLYGTRIRAQLIYGIPVPYLEGWCIAGFAEELRQEVRGWDEKGFPGPYWEDTDLCFRAMLRGFRLSTRPWGIEHLGGASTGPLAKHGESFERNRAVFAQRVQPLAKMLDECDYNWKRLYDVQLSGTSLTGGGQFAIQKWCRIRLSGLK